MRPATVMAQLNTQLMADRNSRPMVELNIQLIMAAVDRSDRSRDRSIESIDSIDSIIFRSFKIFGN